MEEDIKDLEKYISFASKEENFSHNADWKWHKDLATKIQNLIARYKELQEDIGKEYHLGFTQGSYEKDEDWKFKLKEKITEIDKQGDTPHVRDMSYRTKKGFVIYKAHAIRIIEDILED